jgi:large subunit ribosomal protein L21
VKAAIGAGSAPAGEAPAPKAKPAPKKAEAPKADSPKADAPKAEAAPKADAPKAEGQGELPGTKPANLLTEARGGQPDDLKKISGVGPKLEKLLHDNGVFHFDQIAAWNDDEIAYMDEQLSFKGRIARDGWIDQAKQFAAEKE